MKRNIFLLLVMVMTSFYVIGQNAIGIGTGFNFANINQTGFDNNEFAGIENYTFGNVGLIYEHYLDKNWSVVTGFNYSRRGAQAKFQKGVSLFGNEYDIGAKLVHKMDYLELPVLFQYRFNKSRSDFSPYIFAGPIMSYESSYSIDVKAHLLVDINIYRYNVDLNNNIFSRYDFSGVAGAGISLPVKSGNLNIDARYIYGFSDILNNPVVDLNLKHRNIRLGFSYLYNF